MCDDPAHRPLLGVRDPCHDLPMEGGTHDLPARRRRLPEWARYVLVALGTLLVAVGALALYQTMHPSTAPASAPGPLPVGVSADRIPACSRALVDVGRIAGLNERIATDRQDASQWDAEGNASLAMISVQDESSSLT